MWHLHKKMEYNVLWFLWELKVFYVISDITAQGIGGLGSVLLTLLVLSSVCYFLSDHTLTKTHSHTLVDNGAVTQGPSGIPNATTLLSRSALWQIHPPCNRHAILSRNRIRFTLLMSTEKGKKKIILIICSTQEFSHYSPALWPLIAPNGGQYPERRWWKIDSLYGSEASHPLSNGQE